MERFKVICVQKAGQVSPPTEREVEKAIEDDIREGWQFVQIATGGAASGGYQCTWTYVVFKR
jgi:hypothetical protein